MQSLARRITNRNVALVVVVATAALASFGAWHAVRVANDDDLLAFLPADNADVRTFYDINARFGGTDVALVGIEADDALEPAFLDALTRVTGELRRAGGLSQVLSLTNVTDFVADEVSGGIITAELVASLPRTTAEREALRAKVMSRDHVVGNLISADGRAVLIYCFLARDVEPRAMSAKIRAIVLRAFPAARVSWGGNPFISSYVYDTVQEDLRRLSPWAVFVIVVLMLLFLRSAAATVLVLLTTGTAIAFTVGTMQLLGFELNLMLGSMPIVLFAIGSTYSIHVLLRYFEWRKTCDVIAAVASTVTGIGPVVLVAGATAAAAIASFAVMDIVPIRTFGVFTALGILASAGLALTFVPAALRLLAPEQWVLELGKRPQRWLVRMAVFYQARRRGMGWSIAVVLLVFAALVATVETGVDQRSFFATGSPPDRADEFLRRHFGAAQFVQLVIEGDMTSPAVLREVQSLADRLEVMPRVSGVQHVGTALAAINAAMTGQRRIPDTAGQVGNLYGFLAGDAALNQLVTPDHTQALLQIKVDSGERTAVRDTLAAIEELLAGEQLAHYVVVEGATDARAVRRREALLGYRLARLAKRDQVELPADLAAGIQAFAARGDERLEVAPVVTRLRRFLNSAECPVPLPKATAGGEPAVLVAEALAALGERPAEAQITAALATALALPEADPTVQDLMLSVPGTLAEAWVRARAEQRAARLLAALAITTPSGDTGPRFLDDVAMAMIDWTQPAVLLPAAAAAASGHLRMQINGLPVLYRGLAASVRGNQLRSLGVALLLVVLILSVMLGSVRSGLLAAAPTLFTLVVIHGAMGLLGINLDVGTSLLGSLIIANGIDYAVHMLAAWETPDAGALARAAACAADRAGPGIWASAATMFVGFFVLTLGEARVLQNVTGLKAAAMLVGAISTFAIVPVLARRRRYLLLGQPCEAVEPSAAVDDVLLRQEVGQ